MKPECHAYDDIIDLPHPVSQRHPQMSMQARAAQFAPFAALSGYEDAAREAERLTDRPFWAKTRGPRWRKRSRSLLRLPRRSRR